MSLPTNQETLREYFSECEEIVSRFNLTLAEIEKKPANPDLIASLYRDMHTLKGSSQLFGFHAISSLSHAIEACLEPIRKFNLSIPTNILDSLYKSVDLVEKLVGELSKTQKISSSLETSAQNCSQSLIDITTRFLGKSLEVRPEKCPPSELNEANDLTQSSGNKQNDFPPKFENSESFETAGTRGLAEEFGNNTTASSGTSSTNNQTSPGTIRINVDILDNLMNLAGEMVLIRNQFLQMPQIQSNHESQSLVKALDLVTNDIQYEVMKTRMQPISSILTKFNRLVRDLGKDLGKKIDLHIIGGETELDKTLLEALKDPLTHIIRNSCDHGLETPQERSENGKNPNGKITIKSSQEAGYVVIEISDDGRGLDPQKILNKAIEKNLVKPELSSSLSNQDILNLIFAAGFSTADQISEISGRGVGMDVVKTNLEKIGGQINLRSQLKKGLTIHVQIPLTLAVIPSLLIEQNNIKYNIPQMRLIELTRIEGANSPQIEFVQGQPFIRLRGSLVPLVSLSEALQGKIGDHHDLSTDTNVAIVQGPGQNYGIIIEKVLDTIDIVVKPLPGYLKKIQLFSGSTILGDGSVSLILDINGLGAMAKIQSYDRNTNVNHSIHIADNNNYSENQDFLFFKLSTEGSFTFPLCLVSRLEEIEGTKITYSGNNPVINYRNSVLPLISLNEILKPSTLGKGSPHHFLERQPFIVVNKKNKNFGILVNEISDVKNLPTKIEDSFSKQKAILGNLISGSTIHTVLDIFEIIENFITQNEGALSKNETNYSLNSLNGVKILYAEDTAFFANQVRKSLENYGAQLTHVIDGQEAVALLEKSKRNDFDLIISDIEMPNLNGFELAQKIRAHSIWKSVPLIALTTKFRDSDKQRGSESGFNRYLEKLKIEELVSSISDLLHLKSARLERSA